MLVRRRFNSVLLPGAVLVLFAASPRSVPLQARRLVPASAEMPFDLAFTQRALANDRIAVSGNGHWVAFVVSSPLPSGKKDTRWLSSGAPGNVIGKRVEIVDVQTGLSEAVGPNGVNCWRPSFSPDASQLAFYCDDGDAVHLWIRDIHAHTNRLASRAAIKAKLWVGDEPVWNESGTEVNVPLVPESAIRQEPTSRAMSPSSGPKVTVQRAGAEVAGGGITAAEDRKQQIISGQMAENSATLAAIAVSTGAIRRVISAEATPSPSLLKLSPSGRLLAYLSVTGQDLAVVATDTGSTNLAVSGLDINRSAGFALSSWAWHPERDHLFWVQDKRLWSEDFLEKSGGRRQVDSSLTDVTLGPIGFTKDGSHLVIGVRSFRLDDFHNPYPRALAVVPIDGGATRIIDVPPGLYIQNVVFQRGNVLWQPEPPFITVICQEEAGGARVLVRVNLENGRTQILWRGLANIQFAGASADHSVLIGTFEDVSSPNTLYRFDRDVVTKRKLLDLEPRLAALRFGPVETFETAIPQGEGGLSKATTTVLLPVGAHRGDRLPTVVCQYPGLALSHGYAETFGGGTICGVSLALFTTRGYAALLVDSPISPPDIASNPAVEMTAVVLAQVNRAADLGYTDLSRVAIIGGSAGGYSSAAIVTRTQAFRAAIAIEGFYDLPGWNVWPTVIHQRMGTHPWGNLQRYLANSPYYQAADIHTPLLLVHGESDEVPVEEARKLYSALKQLDKTVQLATYAGEGHVLNNWSLSDAVDVSARMVDFLDRYVRSEVDATRARR
jgi:dipeptidyl aminopeptidase/acylaminoacyl peptidase